MRLFANSSRFFLNSSRRFVPLALISLLPGALLAASNLTERYPYDPACQWGRISNGKGMIHRCISQAEAESLGKKANDEVPHKTEPQPAQKEKAPAYELKVGPISSNDGDITIGALHKPLTRYRECIDKNGGVSKEKSQAVIQFLVRAERSRAEGVQVKSVSGMSKEAAQCIADVVDRRKVGQPSQEMMSVELVFETDVQK